MHVAGRSLIIIAEPADQEQQTAMQDQITTTDTDLDEPRDYCFGGTCATCDGHHGQCICLCHARAQEQEQEQEQGQGQEQADDEAPDSWTLAELMAARTRKLDRERREREDMEQRKLEGRRQDALTAFTVRYDKRFPAALRDALNATIGYDTTTEGYDDEAIERGPFATFQYDGAAWIIRRHYHYGAVHWTLEGPDGYFADLGYDEEYSSPAGPILDALNEYPHWLEQKAAREREKAEKAATKATAEHQKRDEQTIYAYVAGDDPGHHGMLNTQSRVWLEIATPDTADERLAYERLDRLSAAIVDWSETWLLINLNDDETCQRLIPIARVVSIQPRA